MSPIQRSNLCLLRLLQWQAGSLPLAPVVTGLFRFSISPWFSLGRFCVLGICPFHLGYPIWGKQLFTAHYYNLFISTKSVKVSPTSFLILVIWVIFIFLLVQLVHDLSILFIFSENKILVLLIFLCCSSILYLIYPHSNLF